MNRTHKFLLFTILCLFIPSLITSGQNDRLISIVTPDFKVYTTEADIIRSGEIFSKLIEDSTYNASEMLVKAATLMIGTPYVAGSLDESKYEQFSVFLTKTDCTLLVETCLHLVITAREYPADAPLDGNIIFSDLAKNILSTRYRTSRTDYYSDRIHYTTEWIRRLEQLGIAKDLSLEYGGQTKPDGIYYMSSNYKKYKHLQNAGSSEFDTYDLEQIRETEKELNKIPLTYIPKNKIRPSDIQNGDIICFCSALPGLDISHLVIATSDSRFIHASSNAMKVIKDSRTITEYVKSQKNISGIKIIRLIQNNN